MKAPCVCTSENFASRCSAIRLNLWAKSPTSSSVSTAARSCRCPSPKCEAVAASFSKGFVNRPTAHTPRKMEAMSTSDQVAAKTRIDSLETSLCLSGTPTATLHPEGLIRLTPVNLVTPSLHLLDSIEACEFSTGADCEIPEGFPMSFPLESKTVKAAPESDETLCARCA